ncbi:hypothetical protein ABPG75_005135 [Micractinium tetrahymenae]
MARLYRALAALAVLAAAAVPVQGAQTDLSWSVGQDYSKGLQVAGGDAVVFSWTGLHSVAKVPSSECPSSPGAAQTLVEPAPGGYWTFTCDGTTAGENHFICPVGSHCQAGQRITITCSA